MTTLCAFLQYESVFQIDPRRTAVAWKIHVAYVVILRLRLLLLLDCVRTDLARGLSLLNTTKLEESMRSVQSDGGGLRNGISITLQHSAIMRIRYLAGHKIWYQSQGGFFLYFICVIRNFESCQKSQSRCTIKKSRIYALLYTNNA